MKNKILSIMICGLMVFGVNTSIVGATGPDTQDPIVVSTDTAIEPVEEVQKVEDVKEVKEVKLDKVVEKVEEVEEVDADSLSSDEVCLLCIIASLTILSSLACYKTVGLEKRIKILEDTKK